MNEQVVEAKLNPSRVQIFVSKYIFSHYRAIGSLAGIAAVGSVLFAAYYHDCKDLIRWLAAGWSVLPPLWFFFEFHNVRAVKGRQELKKTKESQQLAGKVWAGVVAILSVVYLKDGA